MKKLIVCLLLICVIGLGCFALTACNKTDTTAIDNDIPNATECVKLVSNEPVYNYRGGPTVMYNEYQFNIYYLPEWHRPPDESSGVYRAEYAYKPQSQDYYQSVSYLNSSKLPTDSWLPWTFNLTHAEDYIDFRVYEYSLNADTQELDWQFVYEYRLDIKGTYIDHYIPRSMY